LRFLIEEHGGDINRADGTGIVPLAVAAHYGHLALVRCMVKELGDGYTPLCLAVQNGHLAVASCLMKEPGADINQVTNAGSRLLYMAAETGSIDLLRCLIEYGGDVNQATKDGSTPLLIAAQKGYLAAVRYLAKKVGTKLIKQMLKEPRPCTTRRRMAIWMY
jgi:ankyrin repeat protein